MKKNAVALIEDLKKHGISLKIDPQTFSDDRKDVDGNVIEYIGTHNKDGDLRIACVTENVVRILEHHTLFANRLRFDEFSSTIEVCDGDEWRAYRDGDEIRLQCELSVIEPAFMKVSKGMVFDAMLYVAEKHRVNVADEWMRALVWDGVPRVDTWLTHAYGAPKDEYHRTVGMNWLMAIARRTAHPGDKFDHVLILEGEQGTKKSSSLGVLGSVLPNRYWHLETTLNTADKDFFVTMQGKLIVEFSEGESLTRSEVKQLKSIISTRVDTFRAPYGRSSHDYPRRCVLAMTTNQDQYLKDETGNRRWLPVHVEHVSNLEWLRENRDQLYAEAYERAVRRNECYWEFPEEEMRRMQDARRISSPNEDAVVEWYASLPIDAREDGIHVRDVWQQVYHGGSAFGASMKKYEEMEIADIIRRVLMLEKRETRLHGVKAMRWYPPTGVESPIQYVEGAMRDKNDF